MRRPATNLRYAQLTSGPDVIISLLLSKYLSFALPFPRRVGHRCCVEGCQSHCHSWAEWESSLRMRATSQLPPKVFVQGFGSLAFTSFCAKFSFLTLK